MTVQRRTLIIVALVLGSALAGLSFPVQVRMAQMAVDSAGADRARRGSKRGRGRGGAESLTTDGTTGMAVSAFVALSRAEI